jgi:PAS domain S-box-containing protein
MRINEHLDHGHTKTEKITNTLDDLLKSCDQLEQSMNTITVALADTKKQIKREIGGWFQAESSFKNSEERFRLILQNSYDVIYTVYLDTETFEYISPSSEKIFGYTPEELHAMGFQKFSDCIHPEDYQMMIERVKKSLKKNPFIRDLNNVIRFKHKTLGYRWVASTHTIFFDETGNPAALIGNVRDIHEQKKSEIELHRLRNELEREVKERTASLEETNAALKVLLEKRDKDKGELEEKILFNFRELLVPHIEQMKNSKLTDKQRACMQAIESNIDDIISPFSRSLSLQLVPLTSGEIRIADLIKRGHTTKEIAVMLHLSTRTVEFHRLNIREKIGLKNKKNIGLRSYLLTLE